MIRAMIVEDEKIIRTGIKNCIKWETLGIDAVYTAENAEEALKRMENDTFQIIISDICMPGMNGIELCRYYHEKSPESQIIFISGYSEKEYLMAAISLGAVSYVEKPVSAKALTEAVKKAMEAIQRISRVHSSTIHYLLHTDGKQGRDFSGERIFYQGKDSYICACILKIQKVPGGDISDFARRCTECLKNECKEQLYILFEPIQSQLLAGLIIWEKKSGLRETDIKQRIAEVLLSSGDRNCFLAYGNIVEQEFFYKESYRAAEKALGLLACKGWNSWADAKETCREYSGSLSGEMKEEFLSLLMKKKEEAARFYIKNLTSEFSTQHYIMNYYLRNAYFELDRIVLQAYRTLHLEGIPEKVQGEADVLAQAETLEEMSRYLQEHIHEILSENEAEENNNYVIRNAMLYINEHALEKDLSIKMIADSVYLTQTYLSNLFKKKTGFTIGQYILDLRIKAAKQYLKDPKYKLYQIAQLVGYTDPNYFAKTFKKKTGKLPSEYRDEAIHHA